MNLTNLKRMYNYILENVPEEKIFMKSFRGGNEFSHECNSTGCVIGHCTILDNLENIPKHHNGKINFTDWSENFTEISLLSENWDWCFGGRWPDDKKQILLRIKYLIDNQKVPKNWDDNFDYILKSKKLEPYELI